MAIFNVMHSLHWFFAVIAFYYLLYPWFERLEKYRVTLPRWLNVSLVIGSSAALYILGIYCSKNMASVQTVYDGVPDPSTSLAVAVNSNGFPVVAFIHAPENSAAAQW